MHKKELFRKKIQQKSLYFPNNPRRKMDKNLYAHPPSGLAHKITPGISHPEQ